VKEGKREKVRVKGEEWMREERKENVRNGK
jgi:hypothetical protein